MVEGERVVAGRDLQSGDAGVYKDLQASHAGLSAPFQAFVHGCDSDSGVAIGLG
jgi:hypothetical protein